MAVDIPRVNKPFWDLFKDVVPYISCKPRRWMNIQIGDIELFQFYHLHLTPVEKVSCAHIFKLKLQLINITHKISNIF